MAFKQSSNPLSRNTSPMRRSPFRQQTMSMDELNKASAASQEQSRINSQSGTAGAPGDPGTEINYDDPRKFAGDDEGMLQSNFEPQFPGDDGYEDQGMSRESSDEKRLQRKLDRMGKKNSNTADVSDGREEVNEFIQDNGRPGQKRRAQKLNDKVNPSYQGVAPIKGMSDEEARSIDEDTYPDGLSRKTSTPKPPIPMDEPYGLSRKASPLNDKTSRKIKKGNKTARQIVEMQNKRSSYKKTYLGDPDDLEGEMVRTADKPASKREGRKIKKLKKTEKQLGMSRKASPLNGLNDMDGYGGDDSDTNKEETVTKQDNSRSAIKDRKAKDKAKGVSKPQMRANKAKSKSAAAAEKAKTVKNPDYKKQLEAKSERLAKRAKRKEGRADRKANNKANRQANKKSREDSKK